MVIHATQDPQSNRRELIIPLPPSHRNFKSLHQVNGNTPFVFASWGKSGYLSESAVLNGLRRMGYDTGEEMSGHGFRAMARTILEEVLGYRSEVIEQQLAHKIRMQTAEPTTAPRTWMSASGCCRSGRITWTS